MPKYNKKKLDLIDEKLIKLPDDIDKYNNLEILRCSDNKITSLDNIHQKLKVLYCHNNRLTSLDNLPPTLKELVCNDNNLFLKTI